MKKVIKVGFPIVCVVIIGGTFYMLGNLDKRVEDSLRMQQSNNINETREVETDENIVQESVTYTVPVNTSQDNENISNSAEEENVSNDINE